MPEALYVRNFDEDRILLDAAAAVGEVWQLPDGRAAVFKSKAGLCGGVAGSSGDYGDFTTVGEVDLPLTGSITILDGGRVYWDQSANLAHYKKTNDRDFYVGRAVGDSSSNIVRVELNIDPPYDWQLGRDSHDTVYVGTQGLNTMGIFQRGGAFKFIHSTANEAQKFDILGKDGFSKDSNFILEFAIEVVDDGAGTAVDFNVGMANATHADDADSITDSLFMHLNANDVNIYFESDDGTTEVAATDSTIDYAAGTRFEVWMDARNPADVQIYVNGANVLPATTFNINASTATWKFLAHSEKTAAADAYEADIDWARVRIMEH